MPYEELMRHRARRIVLLLPLLVVAACSFNSQDPLTEEEYRWVKHHPDGVRIGVGISYPPYEIYSAKGAYQGLSADYIRLIGEKTGLTFVPVRYRNRQEALKAIAAGEVDVMAALEMSDGLDDTLDFTQPFVSVPAAIITRKEYTEDLTLDRLDGMRIGVTISPQFTSYLRDRHKGTYTIIPLDGGYIGGLRALAVGDVDALICDMALASHYIANARISNLRIAGVTNYSIDLRIASRQDQPELGSILRKGLALIPPHERKAIEEEWLSLEYRPFWASRAFWTGFIVISGAVFGAIVLVLVWNRSLKRQVAQRTMALSSINTVLLGSLECHTEPEVMVRCLDEARIIAGSDQAFLGRIGGDGRLDVLLTASPNSTDAQWTGEQLGGMRLTPEQMEELRVGKVTCSGIAGRVYFVAVPLHRAGTEEARAIAVVRRNRPYLPGEAALLTEVLFAFEEALQRKRTEISLHDKQRQLERAQRMEALGTLAGGIAHDFNNILGVIIANGEMIELFHLGDDPQLETKTKALLTAAYRGRDLVSQIISFARKGTEEVRPLTVGPIIRETVKFLGASLPASISIAADIREPAAAVLANPTQVHQVLMNLCTNAAQAMRGEGGVLRITLSPKEIPPGGDIRPGGYHVLTVSDTGVGIPPELLGRIFDPFFTTKSQGEGTGLGLAVVEGIVKSWGGVVRVHSETGQGSSFQVYLPVSPTPPGTPPSVSVAEGFCPGSGRVLFVDDERELAASCAAFLRRLGYTVETATDGREALALFSQARDRFDIVVTDFSMPGLRGDRLAREMLAMRPDLPIILCTGFSHSFGEADATAMGIRSYLKKPVNLRELAACLNRHIPRHDACHAS